MHPDVVIFLGRIMKILNSDLPEDEKKAEVQKIVDEKGAKK